MMLVAAILIAYLIGSIPTGVILASYFTEVNIRESGSRNIGATNVFRLTGHRLGAVTLAGDAFKGGLMAVLGEALFPSSPLAIGAVAFSAFLGHCFSIYLDFRGGKGVATAAGIYLWLTPLAGLLAAALWVVTFLRWKRSSVGALIAAAALPLLVLAFPTYRAHFWLCIATVAVLTWRHRENIERLVHGSEPKTTNLPSEPS